MTTSALLVSPHEKGRGNTVGKSNENNDLQPETQGNLSESKGVLQKSLGSEERQWAVTAHPYLRKFHFISLLFISLCFFPLKKKVACPLFLLTHPHLPLQLPFILPPTPSFLSLLLNRHSQRNSAEGTSHRQGDGQRAHVTFQGKLPDVLWVGTHFKRKSSEVPEDGKIGQGVGPSTSIYDAFMELALPFNRQFKMISIFMWHLYNWY